MAEYTVTWEAKARGHATVEAESEEEAKRLLDSGEAEGMEIENISELQDFEVIDAEWFQN